jgi:zinc protease
MFARSIRWVGSLGLVFAAQVTAHAGIAISHWQQADGAKVYFVSNPAIPMVDVRIDFDAGSRRDPAGQEGLASAAAELSLWGLSPRNGRPRLSPTQVSAAWADLGAQWSAFATSDRLSYTLRTMSEPAILDKATDLAARHFSDARFEVASWERLRSRWIADWRDRLTRPATVAGHAFNAHVYGMHPYGQHFSEKSLNAIQAFDIANFHSQQLRACDAALTIVGALSKVQATDLARRLTASLPEKADCPLKPAVPEPTPLNGSVNQQVQFGSAQAHVLLGTLGVSVQDPDLFALTLGNHILGAGGFTSRLTQELREKRGLTYGVSSGFSPGRQVGDFQVSLQTRPEQAALALRVAQETLADFVKNGPTDEEVNAAKAHLVGGFVLRLDSNLALRESVASMAWNGRPLDYLDTWTQRMSQITRVDILRAFQRVLGHENWVSVVVGNSP